MHSHTLVLLITGVPLSSVKLSTQSAAFGKHKTGFIFLFLFLTPDDISIEVWEVLNLVLKGFFTSFSNLTKDDAVLLPFTQQLVTYWMHRNLFQRILQSKTRLLFLFLGTLGSSHPHVPMRSRKGKKRSRLRQHQWREGRASGTTMQKHGVTIIRILAENQVILFWQTETKVVTLCAILFSQNLLDNGKHELEKGAEDLLVVIQFNANVERLHPGQILQQIKTSFTVSTNRSNVQDSYSSVRDKPLRNKYFQVSLKLLFCKHWNVPWTAWHGLYDSLHMQYTEGIYLCFLTQCIDNNTLVTLVGVPTGSPSRDVDVRVYVFDTNQSSLPTPFYSVLVSVSVLWPFQLYFIP